MVDAVGVPGMVGVARAGVNVLTGEDVGIPVEVLIGVPTRVEVGVIVAFAEKMGVKPERKRVITITVPKVTSDGFFTRSL